MPESPQEKLSQRVPVEYIFPDDLTSHFSAHFIAQFQQDHFILSFFEIFPPPLLAETDEERLASLKAIDHIDAKCVARVIVTPSKMRELIQILSENLATYQRVIEETPAQAGDGS